MLLHVYCKLNIICVVLAHKKIAVTYPRAHAHTACRCLVAANAMCLAHRLPFAHLWHHRWALPTRAASLYMNTNTIMLDGGDAPRTWSCTQHRMSPSSTSHVQFVQFGTTARGTCPLQHECKLWNRQCARMCFTSTSNDSMHICTRACIQPKDIAYTVRVHMEHSPFPIRESSQLESAREQCAPREQCAQMETSFVREMKHTHSRHISTGEWCLRLTGILLLLHWSSECCIDSANQS
jgi:hypothetical protein